jgi:hypothetical protein
LSELEAGIELMGKKKKKKERREDGVGNYGDPMVRCHYKKSGYSFTYCIIAR